MKFGLVSYIMTPEYRSSDQNPGYLLYIRDEMLPSYIGIMLSRYKDPY